MRSMATMLEDTAHYYPRETVAALFVVGWPALAAGYGVDALIGGFSGCRMSSIALVISEWNAWAQTAVLGAQWMLNLVVMLAALSWAAAAIMLLFAGGNEATRHHGIRILGVSTTAMTLLAVLIPVFSQGVCAAA